jgi:hypothetical protein
MPRHDPILCLTFWLSEAARARIVDARTSASRAETMHHFIMTRAIHRRAKTLRVERARLLR